MLRVLGFNFDCIDLKLIVIGYKIRDDKFDDINILFSFIGFVIYKWYHLSERRTNFVDIKSLFKYELVKKLQLVKYRDILMLNKISHMFLA